MPGHTLHTKALIPRRQDVPSFGSHPMLRDRETLQSGRRSHMGPSIPMEAK